MQMHEMSAVVVAKAVGGVAAVSGAVVVAVQAAGQIPAPAPPTTHTLADWLPWLLGIGGIWFLGQLGKVAAETLRGFFGVWIEGKKKLREIDASSDHGKYLECEAARVAEREHHASEIREYEARVTRLESEMAHYVVTIGERDSQIERHISQTRSLLKSNGLLTDRLTRLSSIVGQNNANLVAQIAESKVKSDPSIPVPVEIKVNADSDPVPVRDVGGGSS